MNWPTVQCLTLDGFRVDHLAQIDALCDAGATWIQLRVKDSTESAIESLVKEAVLKCRHHGARFILNDHVNIAQRTGVDGVHLGKLDMPWEEARRVLGENVILGGTVNSVEDARKASRCGVLDYVGVGPYRFTTTKKNLAKVLSAEQWRDIVKELGSLPSYAIGGVAPSDAGRIRQWGLTGIAVSSGLHSGEEVGGNYKDYEVAWDGAGRPMEGSIL